MFFTPIIGAICVLIVAYVVLALYIPWETLVHKTVFLYCSKYVTPAIIVYVLVLCFGWDRLVALMPSNSTENVFVKQTPRKNAVSTDPNLKYELLVEFGVRYHESNVDLEINVGNSWINTEGWWDKPHLMQKSSSFIASDKPVTINYTDGLFGSITLTPQNVLQDANNPPIYKLKFDGITIVPEKRSLYLLFQSDKPLKLKSTKFNGKTL